MEGGGPQETETPTYSTMSSVSCNDLRLRGPSSNSLRCVQIQSLLLETFLPLASPTASITFTPPKSLRRQPFGYREL